jgi:signal transduction histidine kinase
VTAQGLGATTGRVRLLLPAGGHREARWPAGETAHLAGGALDERTYRVHDRGEHVGDIVLSFHPGTVTAADRRLLEDLVRHAGPALRNLRLTEELRTRLADSTRRAAELRDSCARIVSAADTARYDLERDLHDGTQQLLIALRVQLSLFERQRFADPARALDLLRQVRSQITEAVRQLGDLGAGLYPPTLANEGLAAALTERSSRAGLTVHLEIPASLRQRRFPEQLESAVYFCCLEALQNAAKHARTPVTLRLATDAGALVFTVVDRGPGFDPDAGHTGAGLANMSDRTAAVGGELVVNAAPGAGVTITGRVPIPPGECWHLAGSGW